ncbi:hypothetical protein QZH41_018868 [Actinostola sp. cb2023]|nr:hypothetical protein QZH41_018868 [Actinostola sp. cb2023]
MAVRSSPEKLFLLVCVCLNEKLTQSYCHGVPDKPLSGDTIGTRIDKIAAKYPDREAYVFCQENQRATFAQLKDEIEQVATGFLALGLKKGDRVGIWGPNIREWILTQFATAKAGIVLVNINPAYQVSEVDYALKKVGCKALVMADAHKTQDYYNMIAQLVHELPDSSPGELYSSRYNIDYIILSKLILFNACYRGTLRFLELETLGGKEEQEQLKLLQNDLECDDPINIQFTSGTTGYPKGATLSHHNIINNATCTSEILDYGQQYTRICMPVPLYHCFGMVLGSLTTITHGTTAVYPSRSFDAGATLQAIQKEKCNALYGTPTMFIDMLNHPDCSKCDFSSLRTGVMGGSPCPIEVMKKVYTLFHMPEVTICYGLTETSPVTNQTLRDDPIDLRVSTVGRVHPNTEAKITSANGRVVPIGSAGEICFRGYCVMMGYWGDKEKTDAAIDANGWFHTGDLATMDENGYVTIIGRIKDVIIRGGENIYPTEIEQFLYKHPKIQDVQIIGIPDKRMGEEVCAWIKYV